MFPINSKVMILDPTRSKKTDPRYLGPYVIVNHTANKSYTLEDLTGKLLDRDVPTQQIKLLQDGGTIDVQSTPQEQEYEVRAIIDHKEIGKDKYQYLTTWVGYPYSHQTWETESSFNTMKSINDYWDRRGRAKGGKYRPLPKTVNKRKTPARNKNTRTFAPVQFEHSHATRSRK